MALPGRPLMFLSDGDDMRIKRRDGFKELLRMRQVALSGHEGDIIWSVRQPQRTTA